MILTMLFTFGFIQYVLSIQCYTCPQAGAFCSLPLNLDTGDESNENDVDSLHYDSDYFCQSDHSFNPKTGTETLILRGIRHCQELNTVNRRIYCCKHDNCNRSIPPMTTRLFIPSNDQRYLPSITLTIVSLLFHYVQL